MSKKKVLGNVYKPLPPHTWEKRLPADAGGINKQFLIVIIVIAALIILGLFLYFKGVTVGKAFQPGTTNSAGIPDGLRFLANQPFQVPVRANIGNLRTTGIYFQSVLVSGSCTDLQNPPVTSSLNWPLSSAASSSTVSSIARCETSTPSDIITFDYSTLDIGNAVPATVGDFNIATINFNGRAAGTYRIDTTSFDIVDFSNPTVPLINLIAGTLGSVEITIAECDANNLDVCTETLCPAAGGTWDGTRCITANLCGNNVLNTGETCDDGNVVASDGCSESCQDEVAGAVCGNRILETGETCDDNNVVAGDGCSATCQTETGFTCTGLPSTCTFNCGNGVIDTNETCDDGNVVAGDGCSATCQTENLCGNNVLDTGETCDDGNVVASDGCSESCQDEVAGAVCGNRILETGETCDDGNVVAGDGCGVTCLTETGFTCTGLPSTCTSLSCGVQGTTCDDNNECTTASACNAADACVGTTNANDGVVCVVGGNPGACTAGACNPTSCISASEALCANSCIDIQSDVNNCGSCGNTCATGLTCINGGCRTPPSGNTGNTGSGRSGGSGGGCVPRWDCGSWSYCTNELKISRTCVDTRCRQRESRIESVDCDACDESWVCSLWSQCIGGQQTRTCTDEHACGTSRTTPAKTRTCTIPSQTRDTPSPPPFVAPPSTPPVVQQPSFMKKFKVPIIVGSSIISLIGLTTLLYFLLRKGKVKKAYNFNDLKTWINQERKMGTSNNDIMQILKEKTGWKHEEIQKAFNSLIHVSKNLGNEKPNLNVTKKVAEKTNNRLNHMSGVGGDEKINQR
jgi:cysteine-rich repeat protein